MLPTRLLVLGIDGASPELLRGWADAGHLPNLAGLFRRGRSGNTRGVEGFFIGSTWPCIYTGSSPARHGFHYLIQLSPGTYDFYRREDCGLFAGKAFWSALSDAGRRVAVLDAPLSPIDPTLNGMQVLEWGGHDAVYGFCARPEPLAEAIQARYGDHPVGTRCDGRRSGAEDYASFVDRLLHGVETKSRMTREFLREGGWDLFMQVFSEAHCAGHQCWHLHDSSHPSHDPEIAAALGNPMQRVYEAIDKAIGEILAEAGECNVCVFSSHGMSHWYGAQFLLPEILFRLGVAQRPPPAPRSASSVAVDGATWAWHQLPASVRGRLGGVRSRYGPRKAESNKGLPSLGVDTARSQCFHHRHGLAIGGIRLNLAGREPQGIVQPGAAADAFCEALTEDLMAIIDERSDRSLIRRVVRVAELYEGPYLDELPDLLVEYDDTVPTLSTRVGDGEGATVRVRSPKIGVLEGANTYGRTGEHRSQGLLVAAGPQVEAGVFSRQVSVLDLAPTWSRLLGVELEGTDGRAIEDLAPS